MGLPLSLSHLFVCGGGGGGGGGHGGVYTCDIYTVASRKKCVNKLLMEKQLGPF